jgi:tetratricopeptide (TPR) repeat protein
VVEIEQANSVKTIRGDFMSQGWHGSNWIPGVVTGTMTVAIVVTHQQSAIALTFDQVRQIARPVTVMISHQNGGGSGVIIAKQNNTYTLLTNRHVIEGGGNVYHVQTFDQVVHKQARVVLISQEVDLAMVQFETSKVYPVATLGDSSLTSAGDTVFSFGYPGIYNSTTRRTEQKYYDAEGIVLALDAQQNQGYVIKHRSDTPRGMSGGPSFDAKGRLVAINGRHGEALEFVDGAEAPVMGQRGQILYTGRVYRQIYNGEWFSIPINTVLAQLSRANINVSSLNIDKTPPPNNRERIANPKNSGDFYLRASLSYRQGNIQSAINDYTQAIKLDRNFIEAYLNRGTAFLSLALLNQENPQKAVDDFNGAIQLPSDDITRAYALFRRAHAYSELGNRQSSIEDYTRSVQLYPNNPDAYNNRGIVRAELGDVKGAIEDYTEAIRIDPNYVAAYSNRGAERKLDDPKGAIEDLTQAIRIDPKYGAAYVNRGTVRAELGDVKGAIEDYTAAIQIDRKEAIAYYGRGIARAKLNDLKGAIEDYTEAIRINPKNPSVYNDRAGVRKKLGDVNGAINDLTEAIRIDPKYVTAYNNRGIVRAELDDIKGAIEDYTKAIRIDPKYTAAYENRARARIVLRDTKGAIEDLTQAIQIDPKAADAYYDRGVVLLRGLRDYEGAIKDFTVAVQINPQYVSAYINRGVGRIALRDREGAIKDFTAAIQINPKAADAYYNRGNAFAALGDRKGAIEDYQKAASLYLEQKDTDAYKRTLQKLQKL